MMRATLEIKGFVGYAVPLATNGAGAIEFVKQFTGTIDLLGPKVAMPGMCGGELAKLVVAGRCQMKVLYISGNADDGVLHCALCNSSIAFTQKPFTCGTLARKRRELLQTTNGNAARSLGVSQ
jgi:DNA-binding NtrC family response regulator